MSVVTNLFEAKYLLTKIVLGLSNSLAQYDTRFIWGDRFFECGMYDTAVYCSCSHSNYGVIQGSEIGGLDMDMGTLGYFFASC